MMRRVLVTMVVAGGSLLPGLAGAQGTKLWTVERYDEMEKGSAEGVAIRSDGRLEAGPGTSLLYASGASYVWSIAADGNGGAYVGLGGSAAGSAAVMRVAPGGKATKVFEGKELAVQALRVLADGALLMATSPDGKVYRVPDGGAAAVVFDSAATEEKPKYIWDVATIGSSVFVATGAPAAVYRVDAGAKPVVLFKTADQHIRCLLAGADGTLWAGSDGAGVIYRIATAQKGAKPFAVYAAPRKEITALAMGAGGEVYAAGVGAKTMPTLPPLPVTGTATVSITFVQPLSASAAGANTLVPDGSEVYRIGMDGTPQRLVTLKDDVVYALVVRNGSLLAATGNRGRIYKVDTDGSGRFTDLARLEASQAMAFAAVKDGLLVATSNSGKVFRLGDGPASGATYTSEVFDAQGYSQWGRAEVRAASMGEVGLYERSGNVPSPVMGWSDWVKVTPNQGGAAVPEGRYAQWKAELRGSASVDTVGLNYLPKNVAPVVEELVVVPGARVSTSAASEKSSNTVQINFPGTSNSLSSFGSSSDSSGITALKDKNAVTARWQARDDNGDEMMFALYYRGIGEANWRLLKDKVTDRVYSFDASLLPDGRYELKVVASDAPSHEEGAALTGERVSGEFVVDTTPPVPGALVAAMEGGRIHARLEVTDTVSPISHAEYSVDAGAWQYVEPVGRVSDSLTERYDFMAAVPIATGPVTDAREHVLALRVYDRYENAVTVKAVVK